MIITAIVVLVVGLELLRRGTRGTLPQGEILYSDMGSERIKPEALTSERYRLTGKPDYIIRTKEGLVPVEVKSRARSRRGAAYANHRLQLASNCLLVEETHGAHVAYGEIHYADQIIRVHFDENARRELLKTLECMHASVGIEQRRIHRERARCAGCGHRGNCGQELA
ncbi:MAG: Dna2/Cas4 domain-containing protein [Bryobacteraceae bacterium]